MIPLWIPAVALVVVYLTLLGAYYLRTGAPKNRTVVPAIIRIILICLLLCAFFQPSLTFTFLSRTRPSCALLIDNSQSMTLFNPDSSVIPFVQKYLSLAATEGSDTWRAYIFGDSLKPVSGVSEIAFDLNSSRFPVSSLENELNSVSSLILISDGNWTNARLDNYLPGIRNSRYLLLPARVPRPSVHIDIRQHRNQVRQDSASSVSVHISGYKTHPGPLRLSLTRHSRLLVEKMIDAAPGFFRDTLTVPLPASSTGRHLYRVSLTDDTDSVQSSQQFVQTVVPRHFYAGFHRAAPLLDKRFLSLAIGHSDTWKHAKTPEEATVFFIFSWDPEAARVLQTRAKQSLPVFAGCSPFDNTAPVRPGRLRILPPPPVSEYGPPPFTGELPPPAAMLLFAPYPGKSRSVLLSVKTAGSRNDSRSHDTIPFLFAGKYKGRDALFLTARGTWQWDFRTKALQRELQSFPFSHYLLTIIRRRVLFSTLDSYYLYPAHGAVYENDSLFFTAALPAECNNAARASNRIVILGKVNDTLRDTTVTFVPPPFGSMRFALAPLHAGTYALRSTLAVEDKQFSFADSLHVAQDNSEFEVQGQSTAILDQWGEPVSPERFDDLLDELQEFAGDTERHTRTRTWRITQSWPLLIIILLLLGTEWYIRKRIRLD
ncbi:MAG: hypothetical protein GF350_09245 [Chitinivibrionales bacterium]|nr:hypothetical protein [Chitinivibrionales bacterium]